MTVSTRPPAEFQAKHYKSTLKPIWCPACGDYGVVQAIYRALSAVARAPHEIAFVSGIGCSSRIPGYTTAYGFNTVHGRALPIAQGIKLANPDLLVLVAGGDGDGFSIGGGHVPHAVRRNLDLTYLVMDNQIYGLTKGQLSPTSPQGLQTASSPYGSLEQPVNPLLYVLGYGCNFVAQGTPADMGGLAAIIEEAIRFPGFAFVNIQSPCVTYGRPEAQLKVLKTEMKKLSDLGHDPADRLKAMALAQEYGETLYTGVFYRNPEPPVIYETEVGERRADLARPGHDRRKILDMFLPKEVEVPKAAPGDVAESLAMLGFPTETAPDSPSELGGE
jgi:2-oxoglutarate ferredoxin oxidoreductase subunit beta